MAAPQQPVDVVAANMANLSVQNGQTTSSSGSVANSLREKPPGPIKTPFVDPLPNAKPLPPKALTAEQQAKYDEVFAKVITWTEVPAKDELGGPITDEEKMWLTKECMLRYLRATKWNVPAALKRILDTLTWRREFGLLSHDAEHISPENETGKQVILGYDDNGRPCLYLNPGRQNTEPSHRQVEHLAYMLERVIDLMTPGQEGLALLINFKQSKSRSNTSPPFGIAKEVLNILQTHYPERLGRACVINIPWVANIFLKMITPFIDPITREKLHFNEEVSKYVPKEQLWTELGGDVQFEYDHSVYWPALTALCKERSNERKARWENAGKNVGESEVYLRGGDVPSIAAGQPTAPATAPAPVEAASNVPAAAPIALPSKVDGAAEALPSAAPVAEPIVAPAGTENQKLA